MGWSGFFERIGRKDEAALGTMLCTTLPLEVRQDLTITTNLLLSAPAYITMRVELMQALAPFPEARQRSRKCFTPSNMTPSRHDA